MCALTDPSNKTTVKRLTFKASLIGVILVVLLGLMEHRPSGPSKEQEEDHGVLSPDFWYERVTNAPDHAKYVAVITIGRDMPDNFPFGSTKESTAATESAKAGIQSLETPCRRRLYISELLAVLARFKPRAVALDLWFDPRLCSDQTITDHLFQGLDHLSQQVPVVIGLPAYNPTEIKSDMPAVFAEVANRKPGLGPTDLVLQPVTRHSSERIHEGLVEKNIDARKIPLSWRVFERFDQIGSSGQPHLMDTLSVAAVRAVDPHHRILQRIDALRADGSPQPSSQDHPFTSFIPEQKIPIERAIDVICSSSPGEWKNVCDSRGETHSVEASTFKDKVVLIGFTTREDLHDTLIGKVPGVVLQANYIESLLDSRAFKPVSNWFQIALTALLLLLALLIAGESRSLVITLLATILLSYPVTILLRWFGFYTEVFVGLALASITLLVSFIVHFYFEHLFGSGGGHGKT